MSQTLWIGMNSNAWAESAESPFHFIERAHRANERIWTLFTYPKNIVE